MPNSTRDDGDAITVSWTIDRTELQRRGRKGGQATASRHDPHILTQPARSAFDARFERQVDPHQNLTDEERATCVTEARRRYFSELGRKSAEVRRQRAAQKGGAA